MILILSIFTAVSNIDPSLIFSACPQAARKDLILEIFRFQALHNSVYGNFIRALGIDPETIRQIEMIPFLPVELFKSHKIISGDFVPQTVFSSSGTTGQEQSKHFVKDLSIYESSFRKGFQYFYGDVSDYVVLALLPSYLEREGSSLIFMVDDLIKASRQPESGYYLYNHDDLYKRLTSLQSSGRKVILIGVTYALLDFTERYQMQFPELIVMETGGMKGKRKEMIRAELHTILCDGFGVRRIHSEYGMTELLSQAYSTGEGIFSCPPWMQVLIRDVNDPLTIIEHERLGGVNVIDLANIHSCSFIATQDLGKRKSDGSFEISGRFDNSDIRGCNLLVQ